MNLSTPKVQKSWDVFIRSIKTGLEAYAAFVAAGGINIINLSTATQVKIAALAALATAILNAGLAIHNSVVNATPPVAPVAEEVTTVTDVPVVVPEVPVNQ